MGKVLIVVDMQNDFLTGSLANIDAMAVVPNIQEEIKSNKYDLIVFTQDTHFEDYLSTPEGKALPIKHCIYKTFGWEVEKRLTDTASKSKVRSTFFIKTTFGSTSLWDYIKTFGDFNELTLCGTCTDICVVSNALILKAQSPNTIINVKENCCAGLTPEKHKAAIDVMSSCQINIL